MAQQGDNVVNFFLHEPKFVKRRAFPTAEEIEFFEKFTSLESSVELNRISGGILEADCERLLFKNFEQLPDTKSIDQHIACLFDIFIRRMIQKADGSLKTTKYWLCLRHPDWPGDEIWINHSTHAVADGHTLVNSIAKIMQSNKELRMDKMFQLHMKIFSPQMQGSGGALSESVLKMFGVKKQMVLGDGYCLPKALAIGKVWSDWKRTKKDSMEWKRLNLLWRKISRPRRSEGHLVNKCKEQAQMAKDLLICANMDPNQSAHNRSDLTKLAQYLKEYQIVVWTVSETNVPTLMEKFNEHKEGFIGLLYANMHYDFFVPKFEQLQTKFCFNCAKLVDKYHSIKCDAKCYRCGMLECTKDYEDIVHCENCNIEFCGRQCFKQHLKKRSGSAFTYCHIWERCRFCSKIVKRFIYSQVAHVCGAEKFCLICQKMVRRVHECHHALVSETGRKTLLKKQEDCVLLFLDFETIVAGPDKIYEVKHEVNLVTFRMVCTKCFGASCVHCGPIQHISYKLRPGESGTVLDRFCDFLLTDARLKNVYLLAHNGGRYDYVFLIAELARKTNTTPDFVCNGSTIISATLKLKEQTITFRDSAQYTKMRLASMPKAFGLHIDSKGYFPYLLNFPESYGKKWPTKPPKHFYNPEFMASDEAPAFEKWYEETFHEPFDFDEEILRYCLNDTEILTHGVCKFIQVFLRCFFQEKKMLQICSSIFNGWNPIVQSPTLAGYVMFIMSMEHFSERDVGYIPENGFPGRNNSTLALKYLRWLEHKDPALHIQHSLKGNEFKIGPYFVDGYVAATNTVLEVYGCLWHGCPRCYHNRDMKCPRRQDFTMQKLFDETMARESIIKHMGFNIQIVWECDLSEQLDREPEMALFFKRCRNSFQLLPREAMYGGRTQPFKTFVTADENHSIQYRDFCSLYPFINMKGAAYPRGQPFVIVEDFRAIEHDAPLYYRGLVFCDVLPPVNLDLPVLPYKNNGKLLFPLCRSCCDVTTQEPCTHLKVSERYLTGTWTSDELNLAISKGYKILKFHEVWHWPDERWLLGGFFKEFLGPLLVIKHQASGWPRSNMTDEEKAEHVRIIEENDGVRIDPNLVEFNPALRSLAKLFLNAAWGKDFFKGYCKQAILLISGKFAQNPLKVETRLMKLEEYEEISKFFEAPGYEPKIFKSWDNNMAFVARKVLKEALLTSRFTNIMYGIVTTSAARIRLYDAMQRVGAANLIYCDTDSVMFKQSHGQDLLGDLVGDGLGKLTDEVPKGKRIAEVVTVAAKVYGIRYEDEEESVSYSIKAKGITLNQKNAEKVTFDSMKKMAS
ncbi:hypothetical protein CRE_23329 [Caenorhabditis remanei]|uniref:DNA-directed DNA polymerase n=1 Tax=Caenorhabditis remanei TaxID=31234 RepID=E3MGW2_CAERE|nr:hypothetical protein CRE_23329 [Caenorhabditis remanei]